MTLPDTIVRRDTAELPEGLPLRWEVRSHRDLAHALFIDQFTSRDLRHVREVPISVSAEAPVSLATVANDPLLGLRDDYGEVAVFMVDEAAVYVSLSTGSGSAMVAAPSPARAEAIAQRLAGQLGTATRADDEIAVSFWTAGTSSPRSVRRNITAPGWGEIGSNYEASTQEAVAQLMSAEVPSAGRLVLWHGAPGTGKTSALRALARRWSDWCATHFITDPERFLGQGTAYLLDVLTASPSRRQSPPVRWKLVVLEDAGELLTVDAHERAGHALSRLLNVSDGLLGQGMNVITLVTTNEPLGALHPAVTRPGRCWRAIEFQPLTVAEANGWLAARESPVRVTQPATLAELYEVLRGREPEPARAFGFGLR